MFSETLEQPWTRALNNELPPEDVDVFWHWSSGRDSGDFDGGDTDVLNGAIYFGQGESSDGSGGGTYDEDNALGESVRSFGTAATPTFTIPSTAHSAELSFNYFLETEGLPGFDVAQVLVNGTAIPAAANVEGGALIDGSGQWQSATVDLSDFIGQTVTIQFDFDSIDDYENAFEGWYVDDVKVTFRGFTPADGIELPADGAGISEARVAGVGDLNGDGRDDIAIVTDSEVTVVFGREPDIFIASTSGDDTSYIPYWSEIFFDSVTLTDAEGFAGLDPTRSPQIRVPILMRPVILPEWTWIEMDDRRSRWVQVFARLKPGFTVESAQAPLQGLFRQIREYEATLPLLEASGDTLTLWLETDTWSPAALGLSADAR